MTSLQKLFVGTCFAALIVLPFSQAHAALEIAFGADAISRDGGSGGSSVEDGESFTVTGALLQLRMPDGSIASFSQGSEVKLTSSAGGGVSFELISGTARIDASVGPVTITHMGVPVTVNGGQFVANALPGQGLTGRSLGGSVQVTDASGGSRTVRGAEGFVLASDGSVSRTVDGASNVSPQTRVAGRGTSGQGRAPGNTGQGGAGQGSTGSFSPSQTQSPTGGSRIAAAAAQNAGSGGNNTGGNNTGGNNTGGNNTGGGTFIDPSAVTGTEVAGNVIAYAADAIGVDTRTNVQTTTDAGGALLRYKVGDGSTEDIARNTNSSFESGNAGGTVHIERWAGGATSGNYFNSHNGTRFSQLSRSATQGYHLAYGQAAASLPAQGLATYQLAAATKPTVDDGSFQPGTFTGTMGVLFGAQFGVGVDFSVNMPGDHTYAIRTPGGAADPTTHTTNFDATNKTFSVNSIAVGQGGYSCPTAGCIGIVQGFLGGNQGDAVGLAYQVIDFSAPTDANFRGRRISGAAAFSQSAFDANPTVGGSGSSSAPISSGSVSAPLQADGWYKVSGLSSGDFGFSSENGDRAASFNSNGALISYANRTNGGRTYTRNNAVTADLAGTNYMQVGRWNGGTVQRNGTDFATYNGKRGLLYIAAPNGALPRLPTTGTATYTLLSSVSPIFSDGATAPGTFAGSAAIAFGGVTANVGLDARVTMPEPSGSVVYDITTPGGIVDPTQSAVVANSATGFVGGFYNLGTPTSGLACGGAANCSVNITGQLAGPEARDLGLLYRIGAGANTIGGGALLQRNDDPSLANARVSGTILVETPGTLVIPGNRGSFGANSVSNIVKLNGAGTEIATLEETGTFSITTGTATVADAGAVAGIVNWQRWTNGTPGGTHSGNALPALTGNQSMHIVAASPTGDLPTTGTVSYALVGATKPTIADNSVAPGTFAGSMAVAFGASPKVGLDFDVSIGGHNYDLVTTGGVADPSQSQIALSSTGVFGPSFGAQGSIALPSGGPACTTGNNCGANISGMLTGAGGSHIAAGYTISSGNGSPNVATAVQGVAVFAK